MRVLAVFYELMGQSRIAFESQHLISGRLYVYYSNTTYKGKCPKITKLQNCSTHEYLFAWICVQLILSTSCSLSVLTSPESSIKIYPISLYVEGVTETSSPGGFLFLYYTFLCRRPDDFWGGRMTFFQKCQLKY